MILNIADMIAPTEEVTQTTGDGSDNDEHHTISTTEQARHRKSDKSYLKWTDDMLYYFVKECRNQKVHKKDEDISAEQKWSLVLSKLKTSQLFISLDKETSTTSFLRKKLSDEKKRCKIQYGISDSCVNLSGLSAVPIKHDLIILGIITDENTKNVNGKRNKEGKII